MQATFYSKNGYAYKCVDVEYFDFETITTYNEFGITKEYKKESREWITQRGFEIQTRYVNEDKSYIMFT